MALVPLASVDLAFDVAEAVHVRYFSLIGPFRLQRGFLRRGKDLELELKRGLRALNKNAKM